VNGTSLPRRLWHAGYPVLLFFGLALLAYVQVMVPVAFWGALLGSLLRMFGGNAPFAPQTEDALFRQTMWYQLYANIVGVAAFFPMWRAHRRDPVPPKEKRVTVGSLLLAAGVFVALNLLIAYLMEWLDVTRFFPEPGILDQAIAESGLLIRVLAIALVGPLCEELVFRGVVLHRLCACMPAWAAALVSSALFGIVHLNVVQGVYAFAVGLVLAAFYFRFKNLWVPVAGHVAFNATAVVLSALPGAG
jgi:membrane protease YdiL (CAAX protease family)